MLKEEKQTYKPMVGQIDSKKQLRCYKILTYYLEVEAVAMARLPLLRL